MQYGTYIGHKKCVDCSRILHYTSFKSRGAGKRRSYCKDCGVIRRQVIGISRELKAPSLGLNQGSDIFVQVKRKNKMITYMVTCKQAISLVEEGIAVVVNSNTIRKIYDYRTLRKLILDRDGYKCVYCNGEASTIDHIVPKSLGGRSTVDNMVSCCMRCNQLKADSHINDFLFYYEPYRRQEIVTNEEFINLTINKLIKRLNGINEEFKYCTNLSFKNNEINLLKKVEEVETTVGSLKQLIIKKKRSNRRDRIKSFIELMINKIRVLKYDDD